MLILRGYLALNYRIVFITMGRYYVTYKIWNKQSDWYSTIPEYTLSLHPDKERGVGPYLCSWWVLGRLEWSQATSQGINFQAWLHFSNVHTGNYNFATKLCVACVCSLKCGIGDHPSRYGTSTYTSMSCVVHGAWCTTSFYYIHGQSELMHETGNW